MGWFCALLIVGSDLYHSCGVVIGATQATAARSIGIAVEDVCLAVLAAKNCPFGEQGNTLQGGRTAAAKGGICQNAVEECDIDTVVISVEGYRLDINVGTQKISTAYFCTGGVFQGVLGTLCQVDTQIFNAVFISATVRDFSGVDRQCLLQIFCTAMHCLLIIIRHGITSR